MKLTNGKTYLTREGKEFTVEKVKNGTNYCFQSPDGNGGFELWLESGHRFSPGSPSRFDLVEVKQELDAAGIK